MTNHDASPRRSGAGLTRSVTPVSRMVRADDGYELRTTWYYPVAAPLGVVVVAPAMATPATFYRPFAEVLADAGFLAVTFDYRGMDPGRDVRTMHADLLAWAADAAAVLDTVRTDRDLTWPQVPITWVGHSLGGQFLGFIDHDVLQRILIVASGHGYWRHNPPPLRYWVPLFWHVVVPITVRIFGFYPGRRLKFLGDLPRGVIQQWRRWCLDPGYWEADVPGIRARHAAISAPVTIVHLSDDEILTADGADALLDQLTGTSTERVALTPAQLGSFRVGHHGFFRPRHAPAWTSLVLPRLASTQMVTSDTRVEPRRAVDLA